MSGSCSQYIYSVHAFNDLLLRNLRSAKRALPCRWQKFVEDRRIKRWIFTHQGILDSGGKKLLVIESDRFVCLALID